MILAFKKAFVPKILEGTKIHTIREDKPNRWKVGNKIHFATGVRTKNYNQFKEGECVFVQDVSIIITDMHKYSKGFEQYTLLVTVGSKILNAGKELEEFAVNDGFNSYKEFHDWFHPYITESKSQSFHGKLIHWTDKKYKV